MMHDDEYHQTLEILGSTTATLRLLDLEGAVQALNTIDTLGPVLYPSDYVAARKNLDDQRRLISAALELQRAADALVRAAGGDAVTDARDRAKS